LRKRKRAQVGRADIEGLEYGLLNIKWRGIEWVWEVVRRRKNRSLFCFVVIEFLFVSLILLIFSLEKVIPAV